MPRGNSRISDGLGPRLVVRGPHDGPEAGNNRHVGSWHYWKASIVCSHPTSPYLEKL